MIDNARMYYDPNTRYKRFNLRQLEQSRIYCEFRIFRNKILANHLVLF